MKKITALFLLGLSIIFGGYGLSYGVSSYATSFKSTFPSSPLSSLSTVSGQAGNLCTVCHGTSGGSRNAFGTAYSGAGHTFSTAMQNADSDGDTFSNLIEINAGTFPGNAASFPSGGADTTAPTVSLTAPANGASYTTAQTVVINATAADAVGVARVEFYDGATLLGTDTTSPYSYSWAIGSGNNGSHSLTARAYDAANNMRTSTPAVGVTVNIVTADTTAPTVSLTAPANGASYTTAQTVVINATAADAVGVARVEFYDGATLLGTDTTSPYSYSWAIGSGNNGSHSLTARAYDAANNMRTSTPAVGVTVNIVTADTTAPTVSLTAPANGASYTTAQTVVINATAADAVGVARVEFYDGATLLGTDTTSPYSYSWAIGSGNNGSHSLTARAYDAANNMRTSTPAVGVTVNIVTADTTAPTVSLTAPANGASYTTAQTVVINATAADAVGVARVEFYDGATLLGTDTTSPYSYSWAIGSGNNGSHSLTARAYDAANNMRTSTPAVGVTVNITGTPPPPPPPPPPSPSGSDKKAPKIKSFKAHKSTSSLEVPITAFVATDDVGITEYMVSESNSSTGGNWSATPPSSHIFSSAGKKVLYAYVRDAAGNISKAKKAKVKINMAQQSSLSDSPKSSSSVEQISAQQVSAFNPAVSPLVDSDLTIAEPVAVGSVAEGGDMLTLQVVLGDLAFPVDAYLTLYSPSEGGEPVNAYTLNAQDQFEPLEGAKQVWRTGVTGIQEVISETPVNELIPGKYLIVFEIRTEGSAEVYYTWMTSFTIQ